MKHGIIKAELLRLAKVYRGVITPKLIVDAARPEDSPLHGQFTWDDTEAAEKYREWQARALLRVVVEHVTAGKFDQDINVFVSLTSDRKDEGGYRVMMAVLSDADYRAQLLADAIAEMQLFERKYAMLKELAEVFMAFKKSKALIQIQKGKDIR